MTEQEYNDERAWINGQDGKLDYIMLCHSDFHAEETRMFLEAGFDVVCLVDRDNMLALEPLMGTCITGDAEAWIDARHTDGNAYVIFSMSRHTSIEWFL